MAIRLIIILYLSALVCLYASEKLTFSCHEFPPFSTLENGRAGGVAHEVVSGICSELNILCEFETVPNRRAKLLLKEGIVMAGAPLGWN